MRVSRAARELCRLGGEVKPRSAAELREAATYWERAAALCPVCPAPAVNETESQSSRRCTQLGDGHARAFARLCRLMALGLLSNRSLTLVNQNAQSQPKINPPPPTQHLPLERSAPSTGTVLTIEPGQFAPPPLPLLRTVGRSRRHPRARYTAGARAVLSAVLGLQSGSPPHRITHAPQLRPAPKPATTKVSPFLILPGSGSS